MNDHLKELHKSMADINSIVTKLSKSTRAMEELLKVPAREDVLKERQRQVQEEAYGYRQDDTYRNNELVNAAICYADSNLWYEPGKPPDKWPWAGGFFKPKSRRENLVRAAALLIAEIERLDRAKGTF